MGHAYVLDVDDEHVLLVVVPVPRLLPQGRVEDVWGGGFAVGLNWCLPGSFGAFFTDFPVRDKLS